MQNISLLFIENMLKLYCMSNEKGLHDGHRQRMYERALNYPDSLTEVELLEVLLYSCFTRKNTNPLAHKLIRTFGSIKNVLEADKESLMTVSGIGNKTVAFLQVTAKVYKRVSETKTERVTRRSFEDFKRKATEDFLNKNKECMRVYLLDSKYRVILSVDLSDYNSNKVEVHLLELTKIIIVNKPYGAVLVHNHPSGSFMPSKLDDEATEKIVNLLYFHGVKLIDHIILSEYGAYSYNNENRLPEQGENKCLK